MSIDDDDDPERLREDLRRCQMNAAVTKTHRATVKTRATTMITFENKKCKMISHPSEKIYKNESLES